jgi:fructokinase
MTPASICIFGEVLFDHFPDGSRVLGGAPFNVAWHLQAFGLAPRFISRVGADAEGEAVLEAMREWGMDTQYVQRDEQRPTGRVSVTINTGEPSYDIVTDSAWDAIELRQGQVPDGALLYHGSLAVRAPVSRATLQALLRQAAAGRIFLDVNLRPPWWERDAVMSMIGTANWVKLNHDELDTLAPGTGDRDVQARAFLAANRLQGMILTLGSAGARAFTGAGGYCEARPEDNVTLVDTVGAGDAFTAVCILGISSGWPLQLTLERAQQFASRIVGQRGATVSDPDFYQPLREAWNLPAATDR